MEYNWLVYLSNYYIFMISPDVSDVKVHLIEDVIKKKRKTSEVATILRVSMRTIQRRICRYKYNGIQLLIRSKPWPKSWMAYNRTQKEIEEIVVFLAMKYKQEWPANLKIRLDEKYGIYMDQSTIYRILKRINVRYYNAYQKEKKQRKMYSLEIPWIEIQVDAWYPFGRHRKFVIYSWIDDCTRRVYSKAYESANIVNTKDFIDELIRRFPFAIIGIRTDQWREFSKTITGYLESLHINHIKNEPYHPEHNGKIERYHLTESLWEVKNRPYLISIEEANYMLRNWLSFYNYCRPHTGIGMEKLSPHAKYLQFMYKKRQ
jgi:putative transposase